MTTKKQQLAERQSAIMHVVSDLESVLNALRAGTSPEWFTLDLTTAQLRALFALQQMGPCRMGALAARLGISLSGATGLMDHMVEKSLAERWVCPQDRRSVACGLSSQGKDLAERLLRVRRTQWEEHLDVLTDNELDYAVRGLACLIKGIARSHQQEAAAHATSNL